ncbi:glucan biosynthesis protein [Paracoccus endophyticus]|uniref:glucan biosynthesis protein n=1 Tax=Paracoccus endophyticus TaxID=2233774 RepID=UPI001F0C35BD|nr:glucan biosynthesis protein G [Paracoccus endophyticus]
MKRRLFLGTLTAAATLGLTPGGARPLFAQDAAPPAIPPTDPAEVAPAWSFDRVAERAAELAGKDYARPVANLTAPFADLGYDAYRGIRFRREADPWKLPGFGLDLLPPGMLYTDPVAINLVENGTVRALPFDPSVFQFDTISFPPDAAAAAPGDMGWSGFRLRANLNRPDHLDELAVFQGASYFRALSRGARYGQSARGLALGTGSAEGEEFPAFREFWIHRPGPRDRAVTVQALLDSPSVAGAYEFIITPGQDTVIATRAALFPRRDLPQVGIAPLTSMFWFGPGDGAGEDDYRSAVHDTDGLQMVTGTGQRLWRPLINPPTLQMSAFVDDNPRGFGLAQRMRDFADYQDAEARYELRPSAWVVPRGLWGKGAVSLVEIPVQNEFNDNIVSFWQPAAPLVAGQRHDVAYDLIFGALPPDDAPLARVRQTRTGVSVNGRGARSYVIDYDLILFEGVDDPVAAVTASAGTIEHPYLMRLPDQGVLRLAFEFRDEGAELADLSAVLNGPTGALSETWLARWTRG